MKHKHIVPLVLLFVLAACSEQPTPQVKTSLKASQVKTPLKTKTPLETLQDKVTLSCAKSTAQNAAATCRDVRVELATFVRDEGKKAAQEAHEKAENTALEVFHGINRNAKTTVRTKDLEGWYVHLDTIARFDYQHPPAHIQPNSPAVIEYQKVYNAAWKTYEDSRGTSRKAHEKAKSATDEAFQKAKSAAEAEWVASPEVQAAMKLAEEEQKKEGACPSRQSAIKRAYAVHEAETSKAYRAMEDENLKEFEHMERTTTDLFVKMQSKLIPLKNQAYRSDKSAWYTWLDAKNRQFDGGTLSETIDILKSAEQHPVIAIYLQAEKALDEEYTSTRKLVEDDYTQKRETREGAYVEKRKAIDETYQKALEQARLTRC